MYITHDIATAKYFSDNICVMYAGKIAEYGPTKIVLKNPLHPYTIALMDAVPDPDPQNRFRFRKVVPGERLVQSILLLDVVSILDVPMRQKNAKLKSRF